MSKIPPELEASFARNIILSAEARAHCEAKARPRQRVIPASPTAAITPVVAPEPSALMTTKKPPAEARGPEELSEKLD